MSLPAQLTPALLYLSIWFVIAVVAATTAFIGLRGSSIAQWFNVFGIMLEYFLIWAALAVAVYYLQRGAITSLLGLVRRTAGHLLLLVSILLTLPFVVHTVDWREWQIGDRAPAFHALNIMLYAFVLIAARLLDTYRDNRAREVALHEAELRRAELERSLERSRMDALRAQVNPHFLFNALNSLASLIESSDNEGAYEVVERLAALLRNALDYSRDRVVRLEEELQFLDAYLGIEKIRFGERLIVETDIDERCLRCAVPSFSIQPLVENSIKHAVSGTDTPVTIRVAARTDGSSLTLEVSDDGPGLRDDAQHGVGLSNVSSRLAHLYGDRASLETRNNASGGATVSLHIPRGRPRETRSETNPVVGKPGSGEVAMSV